MNKSIFLSRAIGIYFIIVSVAMFLNMDMFQVKVDLLIHDKALLFVTGFFTIILGILLVLAHNIWEWRVPVIITVIAWITLIKGSLILLYPAWLEQATLVFLQNGSFAYVAAGIDFALGLFLVYWGFKKP